MKDLKERIGRKKRKLALTTWWLNQHSKISFLGQRTGL
jgi:hypothetical protein